MNARRSWVQTERKAHEAWGRLIQRRPRAAMVLHFLVANMAEQNALVCGQKLLAKQVGVHARTVKRAVADLVEEGWIQVVRLNGPGTVNAYVVNSRVAWGQKRTAMPHLSVFSAHVMSDRDDQPEETLRGEQLRKLPTLFPGEAQLPAGPGEEPPSQSELEGFEHELPTRRVVTDDNDGRRFEIDLETGEAQQLIDDGD